MDGGSPKVQSPAVSAEPSDYATLRCSPWSVVKERQSLQVGELPDEVGDTAISLQGLGEKALQCFLLFKNLNRTPPIS